MSTIAVLAARLEVLNQSAFAAAIDKSSAKMDSLTKSIEKSEHALRAFGNKSTSHMNVALKGASRLEGKLSVLGKTAYTSGTQGAAGLAMLGGSLTELAAGFGIVAGTAALGAFLKSIVTSAFEAESVTRALTSALRVQGITSTATRDGILEYSTALQQSSVYGDEAITNVQTMLIQLGRLSGQGLKDATQATLDLAAGLGIDLRSAALLVGKAAAGETSSFSRYGLVLQKTGDDAKDFAAALDAIQGKFGGMAASEVETGAGAWKQLAESFGDLKEVLGGGALPVLTDLAKGLKSVVDVAQSVGKSDSGFARFTLALATLGNSEVLRAYLNARKDGGALGNDTNASLANDRLNEVIAERQKAMAELARLQTIVNKDGPNASVFGPDGGTMNASDAAAEAVANVQRLNGEWATAAERAETLATGVDTVAASIQGLTDAQKKAQEGWAKFWEAGKAAASQNLLEGRLKESRDALTAFLDDLFAVPSGATGIDLKIEETGKALEKLRKQIDEGATNLSEFDDADRAALDAKIEQVKKLVAELEKLKQLKDGTGPLNEMIERMQQSGMVSKLGGEQVTKPLTTAEQRQSFMGSIAGSAGLAGGVATSGSYLQAVGTLLTASEGFQAAIKPVNEMLQQFANILGEPLAVVAPLLEDLAEAARPLLGSIQVMNGVITQMNPMFLLLNAQLRLAAGATKIISDAFINGALALLKAIKAILPKRLEPKWLDDSIKSLKRLRDASDTAAEAMETLGAILPEGYKLLELRRFNADPGTNFPNGGGTGGGSGSSGGPGVAPPGWHYIYRNGQWILWPDGQAAPPDSSGNGATSNGATASGASSNGVSLAGAVIHVHGVQTESELFTKLRKIGQREATVRTGRYGYGGT